ncbi:DUF1674 domain-containing protein [Hoeflea sp. IMCC20628]|uniref:DUF1674 domain-containing protein n=1 Tax=Hoeflea sp. IMCC20628 TaxID=1620421 RepID=UPI0009E55DBB|nr:DUF1674 domain-containing protein [Hoeflea sp. IMCC20628]
MTTTPKTESSSATQPDAKVNGEPLEQRARKLSPAAQRALDEAEARRQARDAEETAAKREIGGRGGADPARYGDWEINGRAIDF